MKYVSSFGLVCLFTLLACGQVKHRDAKISATDSIKVRVYEHKSFLYQNKLPDSAIYFADQGLKLSKRLHYRFGAALMFNRFARINEKYGNQKLALKYQQEALAIFKDLHDELAVADASANMGLLEGKGGKFNTGTRLIENALATYEKRRDTTGLIRTYTRLGEISELKGDSKQALQFYSKAELLHKGIPVSDEYFTLISSIGKLHSKNGNHREAVRYFEKGINQSQASKHIRTYIAFLNNAGKAWDTLGNPEKALAYHQMGLQKAKESGLHEEEARSLMGIASVLRSKDADLSIRHLKNALSIAHSIGHKQLSMEIYRSLSTIYRQQSRYLDALTALEEHHRLLDSLQNANKGHKIAVLQSSYELAESRLHIETLELANQKETDQRNALILAAVSIFIILLVLTVYFYKTNRLNKRLKASNQVKDKLFSIIGHDLRNPIGGITQLLAIMEADELAPEERQYMISEMRRQGDVTLEILNNLLNWGEAQLKGVHIRPTKFEAKGVIAKNIEALHKHAADKGIVVNDHTDPGLMVFGDMDHFDFIMRNLISNAIKFSHPSGRIEINAGVKNTSGEVVFSVKDYGKGISKTQQELFLKSNLDVTFGTKGEKGTGIGLMLSKEFIKVNHQRIWIESEEGKGTTFYFTFSKQTN